MDVLTTNSNTEHFNKKPMEVLNVKAESFQDVRSLNLTNCSLFHSL